MNDQEALSGLRRPGSKDPFSAHLQFHIEWGTRPGGNPEIRAASLPRPRLADKVGISDETLRLWEAGKLPKPENFERLLTVLFGANALYATDKENMILSVEKYRKISSKRTGTARPKLSIRQATPLIGGEHATVTTASVSSPASAAATNISLVVPRYFTGRDEILTTMQAELQRGQRVALHGLRGVGKTVAAAAYAERHSDEYLATWWISAQTEAGIRAALVALGVRLGWCSRNDPERESLEAVRERLRQGACKILLIFDNAIDASAIQAHLPPLRATHVILTSNSHAWRNIATPVKVESWPAAVGASYLTDRGAAWQVRNAAERLAETLGGLPLALAQAAAYCEDLEVTYDEYERRMTAAFMKILNNEKYAPLDYAPGHDGLKNRLTVAATLRLACESVIARNSTAMSLLFALAHLPAEAIPIFLFSGGRQAFDEPLTSALVGEELDKLVAILRSFALVERERTGDHIDPSEAESESLRLHRLVRELVREMFVELIRDEKPDEDAGAARSILLGRLIRACVEVYPANVIDTPELWTRARRLGAIAEGLVGEGLDIPDGAEPPASQLLYRIAKYERVLGGAKSAIRSLTRAVELGKQGLGPDHAFLSAYHVELGICFLENGECESARPHLERSLTIARSALGDDHPWVATSLHALADMYWQLEDLNEAQVHFEQALELRRKVLPPHSPEISNTMRWLSRLRRARGDVEAARLMSESAHGIDSNLISSDRLAAAAGLSSRAYELQEEGRHKEAEALFQRALELRMARLDELHPDVICNLENIGECICAQGDIAGAILYEERALAACTRCYGAEHVRTAAILFRIANLKFDEGDVGSAKEMHERALRVRERKCGENDVNTALSLNDLGFIYQSQGDFSEAKLLFERALKIRRAVYGVWHLHTARSFNNLGYVLHKMKNTVSAEKLYKRSIVINIRLLSLVHSDTARAAINLAHLFRSTGREAKALLLFKWCAECFSKTVGPSHQLTVDAQKALAECAE